jgi:hypothetical protein
MTSSDMRLYPQLRRNPPRVITCDIMIKEHQSNGIGIMDITQLEYLYI